MYKHANAWWSLQLHTLCALHTASRRPALASCAATVRPVYVKVQEGRLVQLGRLAAAVLEGEVDVFKQTTRTPVCVSLFYVIDTGSY